MKQPFIHHHQLRYAKYAQPILHILSTATKFSLAQKMRFICVNRAVCCEIHEHKFHTALCRDISGIRSKGVRVITSLQQIGLENQMVFRLS